MVGKDPLESYQKIEVPCVSTVERGQIFEILSKYSSDIMILGCVSEACKHLTGHDRCQQVVERIKEDLEKLEIEQDRVHYERLSPRMAADLGAFLADWKEALNSDCR